MVYEEVPNILHMVLIAGRKLQDKLLTMITENGGHIINVFYGKWYVKSGFLTDIFGLADDKPKVVITCLITDAEAEIVINTLATDFHFGEPHTGIAYTMPVERLSY